MKNQKGVTLIALIITIIVMLILVVVTINIATTGGLIDKASDAKTQTQAATQNELNQMNTVSDEISYAVKPKTVFDFDATYDNIYVHPTPPIPKERVIFTLNGTATGDSQARNWKFDHDPVDNTLLINRIISYTIDEQSGDAEYSVEQYWYTPEEFEFNISGDVFVIHKGWNHQNATMILTAGEMSGISEDSTSVSIDNDEIPVFSNCTFVTDAEINELDGEPAFDDCKDSINEFISDTPY